VDLIKALRLQPSSRPRLAFTGAGGKTTSLFQLARQLNGPVLVSATTHLALSQLSLGDRHFVVATPADLAVLDQGVPPGVTIITGSQVEAERTQGLEMPLMERLLAIADEHGAALLVEADGARQRPLKAPAENEPPIPTFIEAVLVVAGLSAIGKPLTPDWVHRPERFAALSGLLQGEPISLEAVHRVLAHPDGGLKNIPPGARRIALLNQADTPNLQAAGKALADSILADYQAALVASISPPGVDRMVKPGGVFAVYERTAGIILAAGASLRLGQPKQLLSWEGEPFVHKVARTALEAGLKPVLVVTGSNADIIEAALQDLPVKVVFNPLWEGGQSTSIRAAVENLPEDIGSAVFFLVDQPQIPENLVRCVVDAHARSMTPLVSPRLGASRANPVLFDRDTFSALLSLQGDTGGRVLFSDTNRFPITWVDWLDARISLDVDTFEDYQHLLASYTD
jgi:molybdenum cofactor cytidylyltransferase